MERRVILPSDQLILSEAAIWYSDSPRLDNKWLYIGCIYVCTISGS